MKKQILLLLLAAAVSASCQKNPVEPVVPPADGPSIADSSFFYEQRLYAPGDYGSANWRIPALITLDDGTLLAVNDKRKYNETDLPEDIDVVIRRSTDNGRTWSEPATIAEGTGRKQGYGDPALVTTASGTVVCAFAGGNGYFASTEYDPIRVFMTRSTDNGETWSELTDLTAMLWGSQSQNSACRNYKGAFIASGNGLRLQRGAHAGRILFAASLCRKGNSNISDNFVLYSDDEGLTWQVSNMAYEGGDESKLIELVDGTVLISVRRSGARGYNRSTDGGVNWGTQGTWPEITTNACNGEMLRVYATDQGDSCNLLLHSIPNSINRENVSIFVSYDEGVSWSHPVIIAPGPSAYSSLTLLKDGTIGAYVEKNTSAGFELWYQNFSPRWLREQQGK